ncbi:pancreatic progenitor cell differentiation and proliferation factor-like [Dromiciops gliroides]|uniref:pancreatic progenitor cell differentiation and proliferation factor-like n=1 Tax=Dromiciops gliroides TaxID=33562 RepID=UPI001CC79EF9|nr:pancreatic progenitor cell differentiation and proliferation factor-like [Dromiciops gliroides]
MAAMPSSGSLVATHDCYRRRLGSTFSNSSCGSAEYSGEMIPHHPSHPKSDPGHWWASCFFGKSSHPSMTTVLESPEHSRTFQVAHGMITCDLAQEAMRKRHVIEPSKTNIGSSALAAAPSVLLRCF